MSTFTNRFTCVLLFAAAMAVVVSAIWMSNQADRDVQLAQKEIVIEPLDFVMPVENTKKIDDSALVSVLTNDEQILIRIDCELNLDLTCRAYRISRNRWIGLQKWKPDENGRCPISIEAAVKEGYHGFACVVTNNPTNVKLISVELTRPRLPLSHDEYIWMYSLMFAYDADGRSRVRRIIVLFDGKCVYPEETDCLFKMDKLMVSVDDGWLNRLKRAFQCLVPIKNDFRADAGANIYANNYGDILDGGSQKSKKCKQRKDTDQKGHVRGKIQQ